MFNVNKHANTAKDAWNDRTTNDGWSRSLLGVAMHSVYVGQRATSIRLVTWRCMVQPQCHTFPKAPRIRACKLLPAEGLNFRWCSRGAGLNQHETSRALPG